MHSATYFIAILLASSALSADAARFSLLPGQRSRRPSPLGDGKPSALRFASKSSQGRRMMGETHHVPTVPGVDELQHTQEYQKYSDAGDTMLMTESQGEAGNGQPPKIFEVDSDMRNTLNGNSAHAALERAAGDANGRAASDATRQGWGLASFTQYGHGMRLDASNRGALAGADAQRGIQSNMDDPAAAATAGSDAAWAASYAQSHQWTN
ncbi:hypothetical protein Rsub_06696 [Raphidocelis subcapitata]|uniref:Uncharacterized protein n=1 Tax=Raphidocelis subcapitata TaxID=307507 RepID=A0A2V0P3Y2_9CHLO|nr:hypothetical protein Rsub_06696 [Raphidocelis subcapitata]|eukprot:GBF94581.1 hypothetical protein Rsub_06696 [Raphidocelis subcapitata]